MKAPSVSGELRSAREAICDEDEILRAIAADPRPPAGFTERGTLERLAPIYFAGDSRAIVFRNRLYVSPNTTRPYALRSIFLRNLYAADFYSAERGLNLPMANALATDLATISYDEGFHWTANRLDFEAEPDGSRFEHGPAPLVLFCGNFDGMRMLDELGPDADVASWDDFSSRYDFRRIPASRIIPSEWVRQRLRELLEPFVSGIRHLRAIGFDRIFVHGYPRPRRAERFAQVYGQPKFLRQYHPGAMGKGAIILDQELRSVAERAGARYISGPVDDNGEISPEFTWDDVHYNARGALEVARSVVTVLEGVVE